MGLYRTADFGANNRSFVWSAGQCDAKAMIEENSKRVIS